MEGKKKMELGTKTHDDSEQMLSCWNMWSPITWFPFDSHQKVLIPANIPFNP